MTRFARAKGSKSSNERTPADSTPWEVMKDQLLQSKKDSEESKKREEAEQKRIENYENFLQERKVQKRKATWCDFPENEQKKSNSTDNGVSPAKTKKKKNKNKVSNSSEPQQTEHNKVESKNEEVKTSENADKKREKKKQKKEKSQTENELHNASQVSETQQPPQTDKKNKKKNKKKQNTLSNENATEPESDNTQKAAINNKQFNNEKGQNQPKKRNKKLVDGKPVRRKEMNDHSFQLIVNGRDIELVRYDGFPVMKKDAERLEDLKNSMIKKGIPKSEVQRTMKLERRRAEKALARIKRDVCYNCRKGGHVLSDCPELKSKIPGSDGADGVCFKCGSTEHRQFECKVQKGDKEFRFATCFICKEPGHIARQCPDNPKGLYPNGGSCKLCGDVTHLRKDCPTIMDQKEGSAMKLHTLDSGENIEDVGIQSNIPTTTPTSKKPKKIKF